MYNNSPMQHQSRTRAIKTETYKSAGNEYGKTMFISKPGSLKIHEICTADPMERNRGRTVLLLSLTLQNTHISSSEKCNREAHHSECWRLNPGFWDTDIKPEKFH